MRSDISVLRWLPAERDMKSFGLSDSLGGMAKPSKLCPDCGQSSTIDQRLCVNCLLKRAVGPDETSRESDTSFEQFLADIDVPDREWRLGNYEILEEIARGGMGVVYRARQRHSRRIVALKRILSYHSDSRETLERFRREAEAAASLDHPNILPIYEVSESEGMPFFSMKYAAGGSLREAGATLRSDTRECVALLAKVSRATDYAHRQRILHRDLKPGNILLDSRGEPFVSDFGLAKWLDTSTDLTRTLTVFGTPGYIAPEQAEGATPNLTPAADVYSLGAMLFDLLTGRPPFLGEHALAVIKQASEKPAPKLRSLVSTADRDLETICARCFEREPGARYQSAADLAHDLECWLEGKPIKARRVLPPTRAWRWSRRNPVLVGTAAACLFLGAASIWFLWQEGWVREISVAIKKVLSPREAAEQSKLHQALVEYPVTQDEVEQSHLHQGPQSVQKQLYSRLATQVGFDIKSLTDKLPNFAATVKRDPDVGLYERASAAYIGKDFAEAERLSLQAADEAQKTSPPRTTDVIRGLTLAALSACKATELTRAKEHLDEAERLTDRQHSPQQWATVEEAIANVLLMQGQHLDQAEKIIGTVIDLRNQVYGPQHRETLRSRRRLAWCLHRRGKYEEAEREYRELFKADEKIFGPENRETMQSHFDLVLAMTTGYDETQHITDPEKCLAELRSEVKLEEKVLGPEDPWTLVARGSVINILDYSGQYRESIAQRRELLALTRKVSGPENVNTAIQLGNLGTELAEVGEFKEAAPILREAYRLCEKTRWAADDMTMGFRGRMVVTLVAQNKLLEAEKEARDMLNLSERTVGAERSASSRDVIGIVLYREGRYSEAEAQVRQALHSWEKLEGPNGSDSRDARGRLAIALWHQEKNAEAESVLRDSIAVQEKALGAQVYSLGENIRGRYAKEELDLKPLQSRTLLANTLRDQQKYTEAETEYKQVIQIEEKVLGPENFDTLDACYNYAYQLAQRGKRNEAKALAERAAKGAVKILGAGDPNTREYTNFLEILEKDQPIPTPYMKFHEIFWVGKQT